VRRKSKWVASKKEFSWKKESLPVVDAKFFIKDCFKGDFELGVVQSSPHALSSGKDRHRHAVRGIK
jgi:hypothetical protein